jgi:hypothetical protein
MYSTIAYQTRYCDPDFTATLGKIYGELAMPTTQLVTCEHCGNQWDGNAQCDCDSVAPINEECTKCDGNICNNPDPINEGKQEEVIKDDKPAIDNKYCDPEEQQSLMEIIKDEIEKQRDFIAEDEEEDSDDSEFDSGYETQETSSDESKSDSEDELEDKRIAIEESLTNLNQNRKRKFLETFAEEDMDCDRCYKTSKGKDMILTNRKKFCSRLCKSLWEIE